MNFLSDQGPPPQFQRTHAANDSQYDYLLTGKSYSKFLHVLGGSTPKVEVASSSLCEDT